MKTPRQWADEIEVMDVVVESLENADEIHEISISAFNEQDSYGDRGYIHIETKDGRKFALQLYEID